MHSYGAPETLVTRVGVPAERDHSLSKNIDLVHSEDFLLPLARDVQNHITADMPCHDKFAEQVGQ